MKVCDRAYVTEDEEEESMSEHSYSPGIHRNKYSHTDVYLSPPVCFVSSLVIMENVFTEI